MLYFDLYIAKNPSTIRLEWSETIYLHPKFYRHERTYRKNQRRI